MPVKKQEYRKVCLVMRLLCIFMYIAGFPRTVEQAKQLDHKQKFDIVINLDVPFGEIKRRIEVG